MKKLIILGGGFAGLHVAKKLADGPFDILLIDRQNHHSFQPLYYQVASARLEPANISFPFRKIFQRVRNFTFRLADVTQIDSTQKKVITTAGTYDYDFLVIATGCSTNYFGNEELRKNCLSMKSTTEAINIRNEILLSFERYLSAPPGEREAYLNLVIVGGGPTGVELAGAFAEMKKYILPRDYPRVDFSPLSVTIVEGGRVTLGSMSENAQKASKKYLTEMGVKLHQGAVVTGYDGTSLQLKSGETILTKNVIWAAGVTGNVVPGLEKATIVRNRYTVDRYNRVAGYSDIFAIGDVAYMETPLYPKGHPQLANVAINQGKLLAENLLSISKNKRLKEYEYKDLGSMATIGKHKAVVDLPRFKFHGYMAWFFWMFLHLMLILSVRNKFMIFLNWAWNYVSKDSSLRLILKNTDDGLSPGRGV
jgi:NADH dehydrogenase